MRFAILQGFLRDFVTDLTFRLQIFSRVRLPHKMPAFRRRAGGRAFSNVFFQNQPAKNRWDSTPAAAIETTAATVTMVQVRAVGPAGGAGGAFFRFFLPWSGGPAQTPAVPAPAR